MYLIWILYIRSEHIIYSNYVAYQYAYIIPWHYYYCTLLLITKNVHYYLLWLACNYYEGTSYFADSFTCKTASNDETLYHYRYNAGRLQILTCATRQTSKQISLYYYDRYNKFYERRSNEGSNQYVVMIYIKKI